MFQKGDKIGIVCCSNGQRCTYAEKISHLENTLVEIGLEPVFSNYIYEKNGNDISVSTCHVERSPPVMSSVVETSLKRFFNSLRPVVI